MSVASCSITGHLGEEYGLSCFPSVPSPDSTLGALVFPNPIPTCLDILSILLLGNNLFPPLVCFHFVFEFCWVQLFHSCRLLATCDWISACQDGAILSLEGMILKNQPDLLSLLLFRAVFDGFLQADL